MDNKTKALDIAMSLIDCELPTLEKCRKSAIQMAEWKDKEIKEILLAYTKWLDKRGFFKEDLQCDFPHQIETFLEMEGGHK